SFFSIYFLWVILLGAFIYLCAAYYFSSHFLKDGFKYTLILPFFYFSLHVSYGLGSLFALFGVLFSKNFYRLRFNKKIKQHKFEPKK
ncbi:MAG: hypothetical protein PHR81_01115, partial [Bacteroidales bacterium]|nr:hypothetical protein [Bacteroidales bacterium]